MHLTSSRQDLSASTSGTLHTKRHSQEDPNKDSSAPTKSDMMGSLKSAGSMARYGFKYNVNNNNFWSEFASFLNKNYRRKTYMYFKRKNGFIFGLRFLILKL